MSQSENHRQLLLSLAAGQNESSSLLGYVNLMGIVALGWKLTVEQLYPSERFRGRLDSPSGARFVDADSPTVALLARELVHKWMGGSTPLTDQGLARIAPLSMSLTTRGECSNKSACDCTPGNGCRWGER